MQRETNIAYSFACAATLWLRTGIGCTTCSLIFVIFAVVFSVAIFIVGRIHGGVGGLLNRLEAVETLAEVQGHAKFWGLTLLSDVSDCLRKIDT